MKTRCFYDAVVRCLPQAPGRRVVIVGSATAGIRGTHRNVGGANSREYGRLVTRFFEARGYAVESRLDGLADEDFAWTSHSRLFLSSGGGFSSLVRACCAARGGGQAYEPARGYGYDEDRECADRPRPPIAMQNYSWEGPGWRGRGGAWNGNKTFPVDERKHSTNTHEPCARPSFTTCPSSSASSSS